MLAALIVVVNGAVVPSAPPARMLFGSVVAPLAEAIARIADRTTIAGDVVTLARGAHTCVFHIGVASYRCDATIALAPVAPFARSGIPYVPLGPLVRGFGGDVTLDAARGIVTVRLPPVPLATPTPYAAPVPAVAPTTVFTAAPGPPSPRPVVSGEPLPRRTAVPAVPSRVPGG